MAAIGADRRSHCYIPLPGAPDPHPLKIVRGDSTSRCNLATEQRITLLVRCTDHETKHHCVSANAVNRVLFSTAEQTAGLNSEALSVDSLTGYNSGYRSPTHTHIQYNSIIAILQIIYLEVAYRIARYTSILSGPVCLTRNVCSPTEVDRSDRCRYEATQH